MYRSLSEYIKKLESENELVRIRCRVDTELEIAEIVDRVSKSPGGGKALLFENTGTDFPVLINMLGSDRRISLALGCDDMSELSGRISSLISRITSPKDSLAEKVRMLPLIGQASRWFPHVSKSKGECQQVINTADKADLGMLPVLKCWPADGGRFVTLPIVNTIDPVTGVRNAGMYRMQVFSKDRTGMHWHMHKIGERHYREYRRLGKKMPVSVCLGGDPVYTYAATAPLPDNIDEYFLAGFLRGKPVKLVKCVTNDIYVPADCDFVLEGYIDPMEDKAVEGPFGDHTGFYSLEDLYPVFHLTAITHRRDAVYPATIVGIPPQEDFYISRATEKIFVEPIRFAIQPEVEDIYMPAEGVAHNIALVSIKKSYPGQAFKTASSMWGAGQMMFNKILIVAESGTDLRDAKALAGKLRAVKVPDDVMISRGMLDVLDHATVTPGCGGKIMFDLTANREPEKTKLPDDLPLPEGACAMDTSFSGQWGMVLIKYDFGKEADMRGIAEMLDGSGIKYLVAVDSLSAGLSPSDILWYAAGNYDPGRDTVLYGNMLLLDARAKFPYREGYPSRFPNVVVSDPETIGLVDSRWDEYVLGDFIGSPSLKYRVLSRGYQAAMQE